MYIYLYKLYVMYMPHIYIFYSRKFYSRNVYSNRCKFYSRCCKDGLWRKTVFCHIPSAPFFKLFFHHFGHIPRRCLTLRWSLGWSNAQTIKHIYITKSITYIPPYTSTARTKQVFEAGSKSKFLGLVTPSS